MTLTRPSSTRMLTSALALAAAIPLASVASAANAPFTAEHDITDLESAIFPELQLVDLTGDGAPEIIYNGQNSDLTDNIYILENDGSGDGWLGRPLDPEMLGADEFFVVDMDGDGDKDVVAHSDGGIDGIYWYANGGEGKFWDRHTVAENVEFFWDSLVATDIDGDGDLDIVSGRDSEMVLLVNPGDDSVWSEQTISAHTEFKRVRRIVAADFDGDGDQDLVAVAADYGDVLELLINDGGGAWTLQPLDSQEGLTNVTPVDIDQDGDMDLLGSGRLQSLIYENNGSAKFVAVELEHTGSLLIGPQLEAIDIDEDGDLDIVRAFVQDHNDDAVAVFYNDGGSFTPTVIVSTWQLGTRGDSFLSGAKGMDVGDIDCDGDVDFVLSGSKTSSNGMRMTWFENNTSTEDKGTMCSGDGGGTGGSGTGGSDGSGGGADGGSSASGSGSSGDGDGGGGCSLGGNDDDAGWMSLLVGLGLYFGSRRRRRG